MDGAGSGPIRISRIAGRFLIFDAQAASRVRRTENVNGNLVGTAPQQPTQNLFGGLPVELRPDEAQVLLSSGAAYVIDDAAAHLAILRSRDLVAIGAYTHVLRLKRQAVGTALAERQVQKDAVFSERKALRRRENDPEDKLPLKIDAEKEDEGGLFDDSRIGHHPSLPRTTPRDAPPMTPTSSEGLITAESAQSFQVTGLAHGPLYSVLQKSGYYVTPGLRFGSQSSAYPGDPLRFHAHFMATQYDWDEGIPVLDIVEGGRLATAVKKALLLGGQQPRSDGSLHADDQALVRTFSIEWASM